MDAVYTMRALACTLAFGAILFCQPANAQKYKTAADTLKLNREYGEVSLDMAKLNSRLIEEKNKTADYRQKASSTASDAVSSGQNSRDQAATATNGNTSDTKKAVRDAKRANRQANNAKDAAADEKENSKKIKSLTAKIDKKQKKLAELDEQRTAILSHLNPPVQMISDSTSQH